MLSKFATNADEAVAKLLNCQKVVGMGLLFV